MQTITWICDLKLLELQAEHVIRFIRFYKKKELKGITGTQTFYYVIGNINKNNDIVLEEIRYAQDLKLGRDRPYGQGRAVHYSDLY